MCGLWWDRSLAYRERIDEYYEPLVPVHCRDPEYRDGYPVLFRRAVGDGCGIPGLRRGESGNCVGRAIASDVDGRLL